MPGLTPGEVVIMDLWDAGMSTAAIARQLDSRLDRVTRVVATYHDDGEHKRSSCAMARASAQLARAIQQARKSA